MIFFDITTILSYSLNNFLNDSLNYCDSNRNNKEQVEYNKQKADYNKKLEKYGSLFYLEKKNNKEIKFYKYVII